MQTMRNVHILGSKSFTKAYVSQIWIKSWSIFFSVEIFRNIVKFMITCHC